MTSVGVESSVSERRGKENEGGTRLTHVDPLCAALLHATDLIPEVGKVGSEDGRGDDGTGLSSRHDAACLTISTIVSYARRLELAVP